MAEYSGGKRGLVLSIRPKKYKRTPQQSVVKDAAQCCHIEKGIKRSELIKRMRECVPKFYELKNKGMDKDSIKKELNKKFG